MFQQHVEEAPTVIQPHFSFLYPNLHFVNKVNKKGNSSAFFVPFVSHWHSWWMDGCVCERERAWQTPVPGWEFCNNNACPPCETTWQRNFLGILCCLGVCDERWEGMWRMTHTHTLQECVSRREELACKEKATFTLNVLCLDPPTPHTHTLFSLASTQPQLSPGGCDAAQFSHQALLQDINSIKPQQKINRSMISKQ